MEAGRPSSKWRACLVTLLLLGVLVPAASAEADADLKSTRIVVGFHALPPAASAEGDLYDGATIVRVIPALRAIAVLTLDPAGFTKRQLADTNVRYVENDDPRPLLLDDAPRLSPSGDVGALLAPNDPQYGSMYGPQQVRADVAWDTTLGDMDAAVCVIDTGVRRSHEDLGTTRYLGGYDFVNGDSDPNDDEGHGTHVAGTAVGAIHNGKGVAGMGNTGYYAVKVLDSIGSGTWSDVAAGITWCADNGIANTVLSLSLGASIGATVLADAVHHAFGVKKKLVVAASGNGYCDDCVLYPAAYPEALAVACTTSAQASCDFTSKGAQVSVAAPGQGILSTCFGSDTQYCTKSGTSMSTPHASGVIALALSHHSTLSAACMWQRVNNTAADLGDAGKDNAFGWGRIDAANLLAGTDCAVPPPPPPPPPTYDIYSETFESGAPGWSFTGLWHTSTCRALSPTTSLAYNKAGSCATNYDTGAQNAGEATSPAVTIPPTATYVRLRLASWHSTEVATSFDVKSVLVSADNGTFVAIHQESGTQSTWNARDLDVSSYAGKSIRVKLRFDTGDDLYNGYEGWYVDDVRIASDVPPGPSAPGAPTPTVARGPDLGELTLSWTTPPDGGSPITLYRIYRADNATGPYAAVASLNATTYVDGGLGNGVRKHYRVSAVNELGEGAVSAPRSNVTFTTPGAPVASVARGPGVGELRVSWTLADDGGLPIAHYRVYRADDASGPFALVASPKALAHVDGGLANNVTKHYRVAAVNELGEGELGAVKNGTTFGAPFAVVAKASRGPGPGELRVSWSAPVDGGMNITSYTIFSGESASGSFSSIATTTLTSYVDAGLGDGVTRHYRVLATNAVGNGPLGPPTNATTFTVPGAPKAPTLAPGVGKMTLTWTAGDNGGTPITGYRVYRADNASGPYVLRASVATTTYVDSGLAEGARLWYRVSATNLVGEGAQSADANARTLARPAAPTNLVARPGGQLSTIDLTWQAPADNGGAAITSYRIYRDNVSIGSASVTAFRDRNLEATDHYTYQVAAVNAVGEGPRSNVACARPNPYPAHASVPSCTILGVAQMAAVGVVVEPDVRADPK